MDHFGSFKKTRKRVKLAKKENSKEVLEKKRDEFECEFKV